MLGAGLPRNLGGDGEAGFGDPKPDWDDVILAGTVTVADIAALFAVSPR